MQSRSHTNSRCRVHCCGWTYFGAKKLKKQHTRARIEQSTSKQGEVSAVPEWNRNLIEQNEEKNEENKEKNCQHKIQHVTVQSDTHELNSSIYWGGMRYWNPLNDFYNSTQKKNSSTTEQQWARVDLTMNRVVTYVGSWGEREKRQRLVEQTIGWNMPDWCERLTFKERLKLRNREITIIIRRWSKASLDRGPMIFAQALDRRV